MVPAWESRDWDYFAVADVVVVVVVVAALAAVPASLAVSDMAMVSAGTADVTSVDVSVVVEVSAGFEQAAAVRHRAAAAKGKSLESWDLRTGGSFSRESETMEERP